jgi:hypothetical protein
MLDFNCVNSYTGNDILRQCFGSASIICGSLSGSSEDPYPDFGKIWTKFPEGKQKKFFQSSYLLYRYR